MTPLDGGLHSGRRHVGRTSSESSFVTITPSASTAISDITFAVAAVNEHNRSDQAMSSPALAALLRHGERLQLEHEGVPEADAASIVNFRHSDDAPSGVLPGDMQRKLQACGLDVVEAASGMSVFFMERPARSVQFSITNPDAFIAVIDCVVDEGSASKGFLEAVEQIGADYLAEVSTAIADGVATTLMMASLAVSTGIAPALSRLGLANGPAAKSLRELSINVERQTSLDYLAGESAGLFMASGRVGFNGLNPSSLHRGSPFHFERGWNTIIEVLNKAKENTSENSLFGELAKRAAAHFAAAKEDWLETRGGKSDAATLDALDKAFATVEQQLDSLSPGLVASAELARSMGNSATRA